LDGGDADEVHDDEADGGEEDGGGAAHDVVEELGYLGRMFSSGTRRGGRKGGIRTYWLAGWAVEEGTWVAHAVDEDEIEEKAGYVGEGRSRRDGDGDDPGRILGFLRDAAGN
jgi:hypothetical protein